MKPFAALIVIITLGGGCLRDAVLGHDFPGKDHPVVHGSPLEADITAGYQTYRNVLSEFGQWRADDVYLFEWCPKTVDPTTFVPYRSGGHWTAGDDPEDTPSWESDYWTAWGTITTHHGWWVFDDRADMPLWCWVPGAESTPARVVWRTGDGYVAWAPAPPPTDPDEEADDDDSLHWVFELCGTLLDDALELFVLRGDAVLDLANAMSHWVRAGGEHGHGRRVGPTRGEVAGARRALSEYVLAHPEVGRDGARGPGAPSPTTRSAEGSGTSLPSGMSLYGHMHHASDFGSEARNGSGLPRIAGPSVPGAVESEGRGDVGHGEGARGSSGSAPRFSSGPATFAERPSTASSTFVERSSSPHESHGAYGYVGSGHSSIGGSSASSGHSGKSDGGCGGGGSASSASHHGAGKR